MTRRPAKAGRARGGTSMPEWIAAGVSGLLIAATLGYMVWYGAAHPQGPPRFEVRATEVRHTAGGWLVRFEAHNDGESTAADPLVVGRLTTAGGETEVRSVRLDYLPEHSRRGGGLYFTHDPRQGRLELRVDGYAEP